MIHNQLNKENKLKLKFKNENVACGDLFNVIVAQNIWHRTSGRQKEDVFQQKQ